MTDEKKPESPGPVVVRGGHVKPPPAGARIERPVVEAIAPEAPAARKGDDKRPLWQRLAEQKSRGGAAPGVPGPKGGRGGERGRPGRPPRRGRPAEEAGRKEAGERPAGPTAPASAPPPAPEPTVADEGSFADMLAGSEAAPRRRFEVGEKVAGKIIHIGQDVAFLELGSGSADGLIAATELVDAQGNVAFRVGDIVDGVVVKGGERGVEVSRGFAREHHDRHALAEHVRTGLPVEGVVKAANKGGLEVEVLGQRAFCPMSQIDLRFVGDPAALVGQKLRFKVQRADGRDAVLSRRALLEEERTELAAKTRERLAPGAVFEGKVTSVQEYGAFVDLGGIEGLVHVSELSWDRVSKPGDLLAAGDQVQVQVLRIDQDPKKGERIALSVRALRPRPEPAPGGAERPAVQPPRPPRVGEVVKASVDKIEPFGLFVRFAGGRGLVPAVETGTPRGADLRKAFKVGEEMSCLVTDIDERGRVRLSKTQAEAAEERREAREYMERAAPRGGKGLGTLGDLLRGKLEKK